MNVFKILKLLSALVVLISLAVAGLFGVVVIYHFRPGFFSSQEISDTSENSTAIPWRLPNIETDLPAGERGQQIKYGFQLVTESPKWMGPMVTAPGLQYAGNNLACKNCHLENGTKPGSASWVGVTHRFPQFRARENKEGTIEDRINGCMERSMNGKRLPADSKQMQAIVAYMEWLGENMPKEKEDEYKGFPKIALPDVAGNPETGKGIYIKECAICHGENGEGVKLADTTKGYQFPPLWGKDSYNHGAGMNRLITAAQFIKGNMPFGQASADKPKLTDEEAYHVAAYLVSFDRPLKENADQDFPDLKLKPVSTPYGPWVDSFPAEQHKFGPFKPVIAFYKTKYNIDKKN